MSSIKGITTVVNFSHGVTFTDEWVTVVYETLERTMTIVSTDLLFDEEAGTMTVILGITCPDGLDAGSFVEGVARDAIARAIRCANGEEVMDTASFPIIVPGDVEVFA